MKNQILAVMQGASGSGKSTLASEHIAPLLRALGHEVVIVSTDDEFKVDGVYTFNPKLLGVNHQKAQKKAEDALKLGKSVIVDNTNTQKWEARPYVAMAVAMGISVSFHRATGQYQKTHGVPDFKVGQMRDRLEDLTVESVMASKCPF